MKVNLSVVFLVLLALKLTGVIDWSWWYVTMPLWLGYGILFAFAGIMLLIAFFVALAATLNSGK